MVGLSTLKFVFMFKLDHRCEKMKKYKSYTEEFVIADTLVALL